MGLQVLEGVGHQARATAIVAVAAGAVDDLLGRERVEGAFSDLVEALNSCSCCKSIAAFAATLLLD